MLALVVALLAADPVTVVRCAVTSDPQARVYELQRSGEGEQARWTLAMRSRDAGRSPVVLPLPDARPSLTPGELTLDYRTQNGGREVRWTVARGRARLEVRANFELEVNVDADLDPRVDLMNTDGAIAALACEMDPAR